MSDAFRPLLLVHGAWHSGWSWHRVEPYLREAGINWRTVELPLSSYADDVAAVRASGVELARDCEPELGIIACGHSYGGRVLSTAALAPTPITHLIYVAAPMPDEAMLARYATASRFRGDGIPDFESAWQTFYSSLGRTSAREAYDHLRPMPSMAGDVHGLENRPWREIGTTYVVCGADRALPPEVQREMATGAHYSVELDSDHSPFLSAPRELSQVLIEVCRSGRPA